MVAPVPNLPNRGGQNKAGLRLPRRPYSASNKTGTPAASQSCCSQNTAAAASGVQLCFARPGLVDWARGQPSLWERMRRVLIVYVDADACPVKDEVYRVACRCAVRVVVVAN